MVDIDNDANCSFNMTNSLQHLFLLCLLFADHLLEKTCSLFNFIQEELLLCLLTELLSLALLLKLGNCENKKSEGMNLATSEFVLPRLLVNKILQASSTCMPNGAVSTSQIPLTFLG